MPTVPTFCRICEAACGLLVDTDREGNPRAIRPDRTHPVSAGYACAKGTRFHELAMHPDRLLYPEHRRADGTLERVSWSRAIDQMAAQLGAIRDRHGPHAIGVYFGNPIAFNTRAAIATMRFQRALATRNAFSSISQDCANKFAGAQIVHGSPVIHPLADYANTDLAIVLGMNPMVSQGSFVHFEGGALTFQRLADRGVPVVWVDPRCTESARRVGEHLAIRAGTDVYLLLALLGELGRGVRAGPDVSGLDRLYQLAQTVSPERAQEFTGIDAATIRTLAQRIRGAKSMAMHMSTGVNMGPHGTLCYVLLHAIAYVTGNLDRQGGLLFHPWAPRAADLWKLLGIGTRVTRSRIGDFASVMDQLPGAVLADEILRPGEDQIRALIVIAGDPVRSIPGSSRLREALSKLEFLASIDLFENHTGRLAHWLLPAASWLERGDLAATTVVLQHAPLLQTARASIAPRGESRVESEILSSLLSAMGLNTLGGFWDHIPWDRFVPTGRFGLPAPVPKPGTYLGRGPRTEGHRVRLWDAQLEDDARRITNATQAATRSPFVLLSRRRRLGHNAWIHGAVRDGESESRAWLASDDLRELGIPDGGRVRIDTREGSLEIEAVAAPGVLPGTVVVPHGLPDANVNALIPSGAEYVERVSGQHHMTGIPAAVRAVASEPSTA